MTASTRAVASSSRALSALDNHSISVYRIKDLPRLVDRKIDTYKAGSGWSRIREPDLHLPPLLYLNLFIANRRIVVYL